MLKTCHRKMRIINKLCKKRQEKITISTDTTKSNYKHPEENKRRRRRNLQTKLIEDMRRKKNSHTTTNNSIPSNEKGKHGARDIFQTMKSLGNTHTKTRRAQLWVNKQQL